MKDLDERKSEQFIKNRIEEIRQYFSALTTTEAVCEAIRKKVIQ